MHFMFVFPFMRHTIDRFKYQILRLEESFFVAIFFSFFTKELIKNVSRMFMSGFGTLSSRIFRENRMS